MHASIDLYTIGIIIISLRSIRLVWADYTGLLARYVSFSLAPFHVIFENSTLTAWSRILTSRYSKPRFGKISGTHLHREYIILERRTRFVQLA